MKRTVAFLVFLGLAFPLAAQTSPQTPTDSPGQLPVEMPAGGTVKPSTLPNTPAPSKASPSPVEKMQKKSSTDNTGSRDKGNAKVKTTIASLEVADQNFQDNKVVVSRVTLPKQGWLVIHGDVSGQPGPILGKVSVKAGESTNVAVTLIVPPKTKKLWAMLHVDEGKLGVYDFEIDGPLEQDGSVVTKPFIIQ